MTLPDVHEVVLDNGFRALLVERHTLPLVATAVIYGVGSRDERTGETGLSHFLEHMMFKGTEKLQKGEIDLLTSKLGGSNNAFTDKDHTGYHFTLAADRWETALEIEADRMTNCVLDPHEFEAEKNVVLEELAMGEDDPWSMLWQAVETLCFRVHPYRHPIIGWKEDVQRVTRDGMNDFYRRHYGPNRAFLVCVGDFKRRDAVAKIRELFGPKQPVAERQPVLEEPDHKREERRSVIYAPGTLTRIAMATPTCRMGDRDDFALDLIGHVLAGSKSSRLHRRLVLEEELATHVFTSNEPRLDRGLFWVGAELRQGANPEHAEALIRDELAKLASGGIDAGELKRARTQVRSSFLFEDETALDTALKLARFEAAAQGGYRLLADVLPIYDGLDRRLIREIAETWFQPHAWTVVWSLPEDQDADRPTLGKTKKKAATARARTKKAPKKKAAKKSAAKKSTKKKAAKKKATTKRVTTARKKT